jgi:hypothetical protein
MILMGGLDNSGYTGEFANHDTGGLVVVALVPPQPAVDPPAVLSLVIEESAAASAHIVLDLDVLVLLLAHADSLGSKVSDTPFMQ